MDVESPSSSTPMVGQRQNLPNIPNESPTEGILSPLQSSELKHSNESTILQESFGGVSMETMPDNQSFNNTTLEGYQGDTEASNCGQTHIQG